MTETLLIIGGLFFGVLARTLLPFLRKMKQGKVEKFQKKFLIQGLGAALLAAIAVFLIFPHYEVILPEKIDFLAAVNIFATTFTFGFASNTLVNELLKWQE